MTLLYDNQGARKYLTIKERQAFLQTAKTDAPRAVYTFCLVLAYTGARISEVLAVTPRQFDVETGLVIIRSLKKRPSEKPIYRAVPLPREVLHELNTMHKIKVAQQDPQRVDERVWPWCRTTAWKRIREIMVAANITGTQASPKGLRHGFAIAALEVGVPLNIVGKWLGHARLSTTAIYADAVGDEERAFAEVMWHAL